MVDVVFGPGDHGECAQRLREAIQGLELKGTLYFSYPAFTNLSGNELTKAHATLISEKYGITVFDLSMSQKNKISIGKWTSEIKNRQNELYQNINELIHAYIKPSQRKKITTKVEVVTIVDNLSKKKLDDKIKVATISDLHNVFDSKKSLNTKHLISINSIIHGIYKPRYNRVRNRNKQSGFFAGIFDSPDNDTVRLDIDQIQAALSCPVGPQRIRGLAGSGKTTILALKAAHLHIANPDWNIAVTYRNVALGSYIKSLIQRFMIRLNQGEPDWSRLHIAQSFGDNKSFYSNVTDHYGLLNKVTRSRNEHDPFDAIFETGRRRLAINQSKEPPYDAILIDDSQEFPASFFKFAYAAAKFPKRIVWAYDEFQSLVGYVPLPPKALFGRNKIGRPNVVLREEKGFPPQDIVLGTCYRGTPRTLTVAITLACGIHKKFETKDNRSTIRIYDDPKFWKDIGYEVVDGSLEHGESVTLRRNPSRNIVRATRPTVKMAKPNNTFYFKHFDNPIDQWTWISNRIYNDVTSRNLLPSDILVVFPDFRTARDGHEHLSSRLSEREILSDLVRHPMNRKQIFSRESVKISSIFGAKELEFPMVYFSDAQRCYSDQNPLMMRNRLYTGITRSSAWVRLCLVGRRGEMLGEELRGLARDSYCLNFNYPTRLQMQQMSKCHRQAAPSSIAMQRTISEFSNIIDMIRAKKIPDNTLPYSIRRKLLAYLQESRR